MNFSIFNIDKLDFLSQPTSANKYEWIVHDSPIESEWMKETVIFGKGNPIHLIDQFCGKQPFLINQKYIIDGQLHYPACAVAIVDSNLMDGIVAFMDGATVEDGMRGFINFISTKEWGISPAFYLTEQYAKSTWDNFLLHAKRRMRYFYRFLALDREHFLATDQVRLLPEAISFFLEAGRATSLDELADRHVEYFSSEHTQREALETVEASEIALLKMVLVREFEMRGASAVTQFVAYQQFMSSVVGVALARESQLALHYFCGHAGSLLGIKENTSKKNALKNIRSTAWDLLLLRTPELMLKPPEIAGYVPVGYVATHEQRLAELANLMSVHSTFSDKKSATQYNMAVIPENIIDGIRVELGADMSVPIQRSGNPNIPIGLRDALLNTLAQLLG